MAINTAISVFTDKIRKHVDSSNIAAGAFVDFSQPFVTLNHDIPIAKLISLVIEQNTVSLLRNCLYNRKQGVNHNGFLSSPCTINAGVSQGSILRHLLFSYLH